MLSWSCEALCNGVQGWWCFKAGKVDLQKKPELPKATQKLEVAWLSHSCGGRCHVANIFETQMRDLPESGQSLGIWPVYRKLWNLQTWNPWVVPSPFRFRNRLPACGGSHLFSSFMKSAKVSKGWRGIMQQKFDENRNFTQWERLISMTCWPSKLRKKNTKHRCFGPFVKVFQLPGPDLSQLPRLDCGKVVTNCMDVRLKGEDRSSELYINVHTRCHLIEEDGCH